MESDKIPIEEVNADLVAQIAHCADRTVDGASAGFIIRCENNEVILGDPETSLDG
jgi:hypothetical protein